jgi:hypothetical protein
VYDYNKLKFIPILFLLLYSCNPQESAEKGRISKWYKGNLHTHSYWSDGDEFPEVIMDWYKNHDYQFIGLSDHNILANKEYWKEIEDSLRLVAFQRYLDNYGPDWVNFKKDSGKITVQLKTLEEYKPLFEEKDQFLILQSEEISDRFEDKPLHMNATNLGELIEPQGGSSVVDVLQRNINALLKQRDNSGEPMIIHINHPNFHYAITVEDMIALQGEQFFEVFNGHPQVFNFGDSLHMDTETMWDQINIAYLNSGKPPLYGLATDDSHNYHNSGKQWSNSGRGWIYVQADTLSARSLITAMEQGQFYASNGVKLETVEVIDNMLNIEVMQDGGDYQIQFIGCDKIDAETRVLKEVTGNTASFELSTELLFVRAKIISDKEPLNPIENMAHQTAWTQPVQYSN